MVDVEVRPEFVQAPAVWGGIASARAMKSRRGSIDYMPASDVDFDRPPGAVAQVDIEFAAVICDP